MLKACKLRSIHKYHNLANCYQFTSTTILQTAPIRKYHRLANCSNTQVPRTATKNCYQFTSGKSLQTAPIHKCHELPICCQFTSANCLQTAPIPKYQQLHTAVNSKMPKSCKLLQFTSAKNLQTFVTSQGLQTAPSHKFQKASKMLPTTRPTQYTLKHKPPAASSQEVEVAKHKANWQDKPLFHASLGWEVKKQNPATKGQDLNQQFTVQTFLYRKTIQPTATNGWE